jgi:hypothetical protein
MRQNFLGRERLTKPQPQSRLAKLGFLVVGFFSPQAIFGLAAEFRSLSLQTLVQPSTIFLKEDQIIKFALHGFVEFRTLDELFTHIDKEVGRWQFSTPGEREAFAANLLRRGMQSRVISMQYEKPLEILLTHTRQQLSDAVTQVRTASAPLIFKGSHWHLTSEAYRTNFLQMQDHWKSSLNCWSAAPSIPARVLSNWYIIDEGITLFGARYDSTEHFWQAVKYHPEVRLADLLKLLDVLDRVPWTPWLGKLTGNQGIYQQHTYALEFLRSNLDPKRRKWFRREVAQMIAGGNSSARQVQQRDDTRSGGIRFSALQEKVLWGDLADVFHLIYFFTGSDSGHLEFEGMKQLREALVRYHFDAIYLEGYGTGKVGFISPEFRQLMLEIWKVKYLEMKRFGDVIRSTKGVYLDHFLNDGDSPDIPIPIYVGFLNQIREMALQQKP